MSNRSESYPWRLLRHPPTPKTSGKRPRWKDRSPPPLDLRSILPVQRIRNSAWLGEGECNAGPRGNADSPVHKKWPRDLPAWLFRPICPNPAPSPTTNIDPITRCSNPAWVNANRVSPRWAPGEPWAPALPLKLDATAPPIGVVRMDLEGPRNRDQKSPPALVPGTTYWIQDGQGLRRYGGLPTPLLHNLPPSPLVLESTYQMQEGPDTDWYDDSPTSIPPYSPSSESGGETPMVEEGDQENLLPLALGTADWTQEGLGWYGEFGEATGGRKAPHAELKSSYGQLESLGRIHKPPQPGSASLDSGEGCTKIGPLGLPFSTSELSRGRLAPKEIAPICKGEFEFPVLYLCTPGSTNPDGRGIRPRSTRPPGFGRDPSQESDDYRKPTAESPELWDGNWLSLAEDQEGELLEEPTWSSGFDWVPYTHFEPRTSALSPRSIAPRLRELNDSGEEI